MQSVYQAFQATRENNFDKVFLCVPAYNGQPVIELTFGEVGSRVDALRDYYAWAGFGPGSRIATLLPQRWDFVAHYLALNALGATVVPFNPDNTQADLVYLMAHSEAELILVEADRVRDLEAVRTEVGATFTIADIDAMPSDVCAVRPLADGEPALDTICTILYTSGTTGEPKGCVLTNETHLLAGACYRDMGGVLTMRHGEERFFNPTPFHHVNNLVVTITCCILTANCLILVRRFSPSGWWDEIRATRATVMHYVGIIPSLLMNMPVSPGQQEHGLRFGFGAGIEPQLHRAFEERFGIPLVEIWGMTETPRVFGDNFEPRQIDTRAFGRPTADYQARIADENGNEVARGTPGELLVRDGGSNPRRGFFAGYLKNPEATEAAWKGGWLNTGDVAVQSEDGMLFFVDRLKNIIRRAGENISAAEVEAAIITHPGVRQIAVIAVKDEIRDEEVMACIVPEEGIETGTALADALIDWSLERLSRYKVPGWIGFVDRLPVTASQRLQRTRIFDKGVDPRALPGMIDLRERKRR